MNFFVKFKYYIANKMVVHRTVEHLLHFCGMTVYTENSVLLFAFTSSAKMHVKFCPNVTRVLAVFVDILQIMLNIFFMKTNEASKLFEALAADIRLDIFRLLVKNAPVGLVAGDIAQLLDTPPTNLSFHLKTVVHSGLVSVEREGRFKRYKANLPLMLDVIAYLTSECCWGHPEKCQSYRAQSKVPLHLLPKRQQED